MIHRANRSLLAVMACFWIAAASALAADHPNQQKGFIPGDLYQFNDVDHINLFNGNLNVSLDLGQTFVVDGALSYGFGLSWSGNNWEYGSRTESCVGQEGCPSSGEKTYTQSFLASPRKWNSGLGWLLSLGSLTIDAVRSQSGALIREVPKHYTSPDGADHDFYTTLHAGETMYGTDAFPTVLYTRDGTYLRLRKIKYQNPAGLLVDGWDLDMPGGITHRFNGAGTLFELRDRFGHIVKVTYVTQADGSPKWTITEEGRRSHVVEFKRIPVSGATSPDPSYFDVVKTVKLSSAGGGTAEYVFNYGAEAPCDPEISNGCELVRLSRQTPSSDPVLGKTVRAPLLRSITLPDGSSYSMTKTGNVPDYDLGDQINLSDHWTFPESARSYSGHITGLVLPTGGKLEWSYQPYTFPEESPVARTGPTGLTSIGTPLQRAVGVSERRQYGLSDTLLSKTVYTTQLISLSLAGPPPVYIAPRTLINRITAQTAGGTTVSKTVNYFSVDSRVEMRPYYARPFTAETDPENDGPSDVTNPETSVTPPRYLATKIYDAADQLQRHTMVRYETDGNGENGRVVSEKTVYVTDSNRFHAVDHSDFDGLGHYRTSTTSGNFGAGDVQTTKTAYNKRDNAVDTTNGPNVGTWGSTSEPFQMLADTDPWVLNTYTSQETTEGSVTAKSLFCFDWDTGFLLRQRSMSGLTAQASDVVTRYTGTAGNVTREEWFGGDKQAVETTALCGMNLPTKPAYRIDSTYSNGALATATYWDPVANQAMSFKSQDRDIDASTGLVTTSRDTAGVATSFEYDTSGRLSWMKPTGSAWTEYVYKRAGETGYTNATVLINQRPNNEPTGTALTESKIEFDGLGRVWKEHQRMPSGTWSQRETRYHALGWKVRVSELETTPANWTIFSNFDAFGRPGKITAPDLSETTFTYTGVRTTTRTTSVATSATASTNAVTTEVYDAQGRLVTVEEKSGNTSASKTAGDNVVTSYTYDVGGRLATVQMMHGAVPQNRSFVHDQRGFLTSETHPEKGTTNYESYDARGHATKKTEGGVVTNLTFDSAERLTQIATPTKTLKEFKFGDPNDETNLRHGKLVKAISHNDPSVGTTTTTHEYEYKTTSGQVSKRTTTIARGGQTIQQSEHGADYDTLGMPKTVTMPTCTAGGCTTGNGTASFENVRTRGFLTSVKRQVGQTTHTYGSLGYHASGSVKTVEHSSSATPAPTDSYESTNGLPRPSKIIFSGGTTCPGISSSAITAPTTICGGASGSASVPSRVAENITHEWTITGAVPATATGDSVNFTANSTGVIALTVTARSTCGATAASAKNVEITSLPTAALTTAPTTIQRGQSVSLAVTLTGPAPRRIVWSDGVAEDIVTDTWTRNVSPEITTTFSIASVSANGCNGTVSGTTPITVIPPPPTFVDAATQENRTVLITWASVSGASSYQVERRTQRDAIGTVVGTSFTSSFIDTVPGSDLPTAYVYYVRTMDAAGTLSGYGPYDHATCATSLYSQPQLSPAVTLVKAADIEELRRGVDALRFAYYLSGAFSAGHTPSGVIKASDFTTLISAINELRALTGGPPFAYTGGVPVPAAGGVVLAAHVQQLREALR